MIIVKNLLTLQPFVVSLPALGGGQKLFEWTAGQEFFESFGNSEILDADLAVTARITCGGLTAKAACEIRGSVTVACDRCLEDLEIPVSTSFEETYAPESGELDLSQDIYDYVCTSLPLRKVHADGECNVETTKYLSE